MMFVIAVSPNTEGQGSTDKIVGEKTVKGGCKTVVVAVWTEGQEELYCPSEGRQGTLLPHQAALACLQPPNFRRRLGAIGLLVPY